MIGADFEKIQFVLFGLDLIEPMAIITDTILGVISVWFGWKLTKFNSNHPFRTYWIWFFLVFGIGAFVGGLGHTFFNYWGIPGKFPSWIAGPISIYLLEQAMISVHPSDERIDQFKLISFWKMVLVYLAFSLVCIYAPIEKNPQLAFLPTAINTILGVSLTAGLLGRYYTKNLQPEYRYFILGVLVMLPTAFIFLLKINLHAWFDKNDLSHILMIIGITYFYIGAKRILKTLN